MKWMNLHNLCIGLIGISVIILAFLISIEEVDNEGRNYLEFKMIKFFSNDDFYFKSYSEGLHREITLEIPPKVNIVDDKIPIFMLNTSMSRFYSLSFDQSFPKLKLRYIEYYKEKRDTIIPNNYGCGTGQFFRKIEKNQVMRDSIFNPYQMYLFELQYRDQNSVIPDSTTINVGIMACSLPWSIFRSDIIYSNTWKVDGKQIHEDLTRLRLTTSY